jgi:hypothetical protein
MICAGLDLGQQQDFAALVLARAATNPVRMKIVYAQQFPLGSNYLAVIDSVEKAIHAAAATSEEVGLAIDRLGPGGPCVDLLIQRELPVGRLLAVAATSARSAQLQARAAGDPPSLERWQVGKSMLFRNLLSLINSDRFQVSSSVDFAQSEYLKAEFSSLAARISATGYVKIEAKSGRHDDILSATVLACWAAFTWKGLEPNAKVA